MIYRGRGFKYELTLAQVLRSPGRLVEAVYGVPVVTDAELEADRLLAQPLVYHGGVEDG